MTKQPHIIVIQDDVYMFYHIKQKSEAISKTVTSHWVEENCKTLGTGGNGISYLCLGNHYLIHPETLYPYSDYPESLLAVQ